MELLTQKLNLKSDEVVISAVDNLIANHGIEAVKEWRDKSKHKHAIVHILVNFNKQRALSALLPKLDQVNLPRSSDQCTPLHLSIWKKNLELSSILFKLGADSSLKNSYDEDCEMLKEQVAQANNIVFIDLELTAVPSEPTSSILEVAIVVTDMHLAEIARKGWVVSKPADEMAKLSKWHQNNFKSEEEGGNGLFDAIAAASSMGIEDIAKEVLEFVQGHCPEKACSLAGFSVHGDREILKKEIPALYNYMSHQIIDVSTIMNLSGKWKPAALIGKPDQQKGNHRAMYDVVHSIETLKHLKQQLWE
jgi:oligoribonuclease